MAVPLFDLSGCDVVGRNERAMRTIESCAADHALIDAGIGFAGFAPIPGAGLLSIGGSLAAQVPVYRGLARRLAEIYEAKPGHSPTDAMIDGLLLDSTMTAGAGTLALGPGVSWEDAFNGEFFAEIIGDLVREIGLGGLLSIVPILGGFATIGLDVAIAATMTWRVGTMVSIYYQNGGKWLVSRNRTYELSKELGGGLSPKIQDRLDLNQISNRISEVRKWMVEKVTNFIRALLAKAPNTPIQRVREFLRKKEIPPSIIEESIKRIQDDWLNGGLGLN